MQKIIGAFIPFSERFIDIAIRETKIINVSSDNKSVPAGKYYLVESYCGEKKCDCRKVMLTIMPVKKPHNIFATIGYGWETIKYYQEWMHGDQKMAKLMIGTYLEPGGIQTKYSNHFLQIINTQIDEEYKKYIITHYKLWKK